MAPNPSCTALRAAKEKKGLSYGEIAQQMGEPEQHVIDICTGTATATQKEFNDLARILDVKEAPHDAAHVTQ